MAVAAVVAMAVLAAGVLLAAAAASVATAVIAAAVAIVAADAAPVATAAMAAAMAAAAMAVATAVAVVLTPVRKWRLLPHRLVAMRLPRLRPRHNIAGCLVEKLGVPVGMRALSRLAGKYRNLKDRTSREVRSFFILLPAEVCTVR
jgi:hypothetical protein